MQTINVFDKLRLGQSSTSFALAQPAQPVAHEVDSAIGRRPIQLNGFVA